MKCMYARCRSWLGCLVLVGGLSLPIIGQEPAVPHAPIANGDMNQMIDRTLTVIGHIKLAEKDYYKIATLRFELDNAKSALELRMEYSNLLLHRIEERTKASEALILEWNSTLSDLEDQSIKESESPLQTLETLEFLSRNCLLEKLRLQWESSAEEAKLMSEKETTEQALQSEKIRLETAELELKGLELKVASASARLEGLKQQHVSGIIPASELKQAEEIVQDLQLKLNVSRKNHEAKLSDSKRNLVLALQKHALQQKSLQERGDLIDKQLKQLNLQKKYAEKAAMVRAKIAREENALASTQQLAQQTKTELVTCQTLLDLLQIAGKKIDKKE